MKTTIVCALLLWGSFAVGQKPAAQPKPAGTSQKSSAATDHASAEQVRKLLDVLQVRDSLQFTLDAMKAQMKNGAVEMLREKVPTPSPDQLKRLNQIVDQAFGEVSMDDLIQDVIPVYQRHLTRADAQALINFYSSPVGLKLRREQPAIMKETVQATSARQQEKMERLLAKVEIQIQQLVEADQGK